MADSFAVSGSTISFTTIADSSTRSRDSAMTIQHIPGGTTVYIDVGGALNVTLGMQIFLSSAANYIALENFVGRQGTLVYVDGTAACTLLKSLNRKSRLPNGQTFASAEFILAAS
jgi:hypothetical protein